MSTQLPPTSAERLAARQQATPSLVMQLLVLAAGILGTAVIATVLTTVTSTTNPIWVLSVIVAGFACFLGLLATTAWSMRALVSGLAKPRVSGGLYLTSLLAVGGIIAWTADAPSLAYGLPLVAALLVGALATFAAMRGRTRAARRSRLRSGAHVMGRVTDDGLAEFPDTPNVKLAQVVVTFRDHQGTDRWVTVAAAQTPARPIAVGDEVDVWFDASRPEDAARIVVEHDNGSSRIVATRASAALRG